MLDAFANLSRADPGFGKGLHQGKGVGGCTRVVGLWSRRSGQPPRS